MNPEFALRTGIELQQLLTHLPSEQLSEADLQLLLCLIIPALLSIFSGICFVAYKSSHPTSNSEDKDIPPQSPDGHSKLPRKNKSVKFRGEKLPENPPPEETYNN